MARHIVTHALCGLALLAGAGSAWAADEVRATECLLQSSATLFRIPAVSGFIRAVEGKVLIRPIAQAREGESP